ncbi:RNA-dependent RNA polymerase [Carpione rhabdovirus]|nr:RNA-dependent RNA polymerase [Carpione rhabdovirus]
MDFFEFDEEVKQERLPAECSLNSPLNLSLSLQLFGRLPPQTENIRRQSNRIKKHLRDLHPELRLEDLHIDSTRLQSGLIPHLLSLQTNSFNSSLFDNWGILSNYYKSLDYSLPAASEFDFEAVADYWNVATLMRDMILSSQKIKKRKLNDTRYQIGDVEFEFFQGVVFVRPGPEGLHEGYLAGGKTAAMTYPELLSCFKIINQRAQSLLMCTICRRLEPELVPHPDKIRAVYREVDSILLRAGQTAIDLLKLWEPIVLTHLGDLLGDRFGLEDDFKTTIRQEAEKLAVDNSVTLSYDRLVEILQSEKEPQPLFQFFGLFKHFAYPRVFSRDTIAAIHSVSDRPSANDPTNYLNDQCEIRKEFFCRYLAAYHRAPLMDLSDLSPGSFLRKSLESGRLPNEKSPLYSNTEWFFVRYEKSIEWPLSDTLSTFLSDKAITQGRETWLENETSSRDTSEKRLLLKFLKENESSVEQIVTEASKIYDVEDDRIIALKVKEMELKLKGRGFGLMTFKPRLLQVLRESIAKKTSKLFPEITMTTSELDLKKKKFMLSRKSDDRRGYVHMSKSLDINKFCTSQRQFNSKAVFECLDELMGTPDLFSRAHEIFEKTWIVDGSASDPPNLKKFERLYNEALALGVEAPHVWEDGVFSGLMGGIEGLCQYVWTICLLLRVERVLKKTNLTHFIMAQGDNVIINIIIPIEIERDGSYSPNERDRVRNVSREIDLDLERELLKSGLTLKIEETLSSEHISIYGKDLHCPQHLTLALKKAASASIISSEQYQDVPTFLSGLSTSVETISECTNNKVCAHLFGVILALAGWKSLCVSQTWKGWEYPFHMGETIKKIRGQGIKLEPSEKLTVTYKIESDPERKSLELLLTSSLLGSALGMLSFPTPIDLEKRGVGDYITHRLAISRMAVKSGHLPSRIAKMVLSSLNLPLSNETSLSKLFESPFSLNLATEEDAASVIKRMSRDTLKELDVKNESLAAHIKNMERGIADLDEELSNARTINPRVMHLIRDITDEMESQMFVTKFATARTMRSVALENQGDVSVVSLLNKKSKQKETYTIWRTQRKIVEPWNCSTELAKELRDKSWDRDIIGVTSPSPIEATKFRNEDPSTWEDAKLDEHFSINYYLSRPSLLQKQAKLERGPLVPYYGTQTKPLVSKAYMEMKGNPKTNKALRLLSLRETVVKIGSNLDKIIVKLCTRALDLDLSTLPSLRAQEEASAGEGLRGGLKESMSPVGPDNFYTNITHKVFNRKWLSQFHVNLADFIIWGIVQTRKTMVVEGSLKGNLPVCTPSCVKCFRPKERVFVDVDASPKWECQEGIKDAAKLYFTTWCDLPRMSSLPEPEDNEKIRLVGRSLSCRKDSMGETTTKFYTVPPESIRLLHPCELILGYSEGLIFSFLKSQHKELGSIYHPSAAEFLTQMEKFILDTQELHAKQLGYLFQDEESIEELLQSGLCPYIPRSIPLTITELKGACCITVSQATSVVLENKKIIPTIPENGATEDELNLGLLAAHTLGTLFEKQSPHLVYLDCDITQHLPAWNPSLPSEIITSENFLIEGKKITLIANETRIGAEKWEERKWTCSNSRQIIAKGVKTKSLFIHQNIPQSIGEEPTLIMVIGGGLGGCVVPYLQHWKKPSVIFTTLFNERERISEDGDLTIPPELLVRGLSHRMIEKELLEAELCDVTVKGNRQSMLQAARRYIGPNHHVVLVDEIENRGDSESSLQSSIREFVESLAKCCRLTSVHTLREPSLKQFTQRLNSLRRGKKSIDLHWNRYNRRDQYEAIVTISHHAKDTEYIFATKTIQEAFQTIDDSLSVERRLEAHYWKLPTLPLRERKILLGYVSSVFLKLGLIVTERHMTSQALIEILETTGPQMISWKEKQEFRAWASGDEVKEKGITQEKITALLCFAWVLKGLKYGTWETDMDATVLKEIHITRGPRLCALDEKPRIIYATFRLQGKKRVEDLKGYLGALLHLETFFPLGDN